MAFIHRIFTFPALSLVVGAAALQAGDLPLYLPTGQEQRVIDIYRQTPELRGLYESRRNWVFVPVLHREIAPGCYLLGVEVGSGAIIYQFSLVKKQSDGSWVLLNYTQMNAGYPMQDCRCSIENDQYHVEMLSGGEWIPVFSGRFSQPTWTYQYIDSQERMPCRLLDFHFLADTM